MARDDKHPSAFDVRVGKDLLELVSSAMYVDPLTAYREYLQNAADSIDEARRLGLLGPKEAGRVDIFLDQAERKVRIRDNGIAIPRKEALDRLLALGGSSKRGTGARGFRGVGRLAALGYSQYLTFRTRSQGEDVLTEVTWDARRLRAALADEDTVDLATLVASIVDVRTAPAREEAERFFEVEIGRVVRQRGDRLLDPNAVEDYIAQIAPVPFSSEFRYGVEIASALNAVAPLGELAVTINGGEPITRPHRDAMPLGVYSTEIHELTIRELPGMDGQLAAIAWFAHHDYKGAIPATGLVKGVRVRVGNIQVGDQTILEQIFPESRFNSWAIGEVHVFDRRVVPNGRRDEFEGNAHYANIVNQLAPVGRDIARRCRTSSTLRSKLRDFELARREACERIAIIEQGAVPECAQVAEIGRASQALARMRRLADTEIFQGNLREEMSAKVADLEAELARVADAASVDPLDMIEKDHREAYRQVFNLIYQCSTNRVAAKSLVDKILRRLPA